MTSKAFTLIEVLVASMLTGLLATLALAPVVLSVRRSVEAQESYTDMAALTRTLSFIERDLSQSMRLSPYALSVKDNVIIAMTSSPSLQGMSAASVVYKKTEGGILHVDEIPGLYRWIVPAVSPSEIDTEKLKPEDAQLVLPYVNGFTVEVPTGSHREERMKEYTGQLPAGIYIGISRGETSEDIILTFP